jgi:DNA-binding NarL/FixJ family response regulator
MAELVAGVASLGAQSRIRVQEVLSHTVHGKYPACGVAYPSMPKPRVLLADDHVMLLSAFRTLLEDDCDVVGTASNGRDLVELAAELKPDLILLDVAMPLMNGLEAARQVKQANPDIHIIFLTMNDDPDVAAEAFRGGASGYLLKSSAGSELMTAVREAMKGLSYVTPLMTGGLVEHMLLPRGASSVDSLTSRQREVIQLVAEGKSLKEIAAILDITPRTAAFHKYKIMEQLHIKTTAELIQYALKHHIV